MKGRFLPLWCVAVLATAAAFVVHLSIRFETVRLGYEVSEERGRQRELLQDRRLLSIEAATLRQSGRIETIARGTLGMEVPKPTRIVTMREPETRSAAGRVR
jgi:cell division protein FtsL